VAALEGYWCHEYFLLKQWFLIGVRPNPWGSVSQAQGFGRGRLKYKHSYRVQSDWSQQADKRKRRVGGDSEKLLSFVSGELLFYL